MPDQQIVPRPSSSPKKKFLRGLVHAFATIGGMYLAQKMGEKPELAAAVPVVLGPLGGWLRDKFPDSANVIPF